ncbi:aldolase/citrate lyase family protein [Microvirga antarctica]|uniref:aldolase/citrate lyase family protein n=1 Tax=Microvirga antarctica TaxID=2819233 RepID=UPI001B308BCE
MYERDGLTLRARLKQGGPIGVFWFAVGSSALVEISDEARPDAMVIDAQHGLWDRGTIEHAVAAVGRTPVLIRTADNAHSSISQALDTGAEGVLVPLIETDEQAAQAVAASRFPPHGHRSGGGVRPLKGDFAAYHANANARTVVGVMIETERGVRNAAAIANTPGIDFVLIGTGDLALSLGCFPKIDSRHEDACRTVFQACRNAGVPCGIFTPSAEAAAKRTKEGYALVVVANDIDVAARGFSTSMTQFSTETAAIRKGQQAAAARSASMSSNLLVEFAAGIADGRIRVVDLTQTLRPSTPVIQLPPEFAPSNPFRMLEISKYDERGPGWYWNNIACGEHTGTHFDAPVHWVTGQHHADGFTDTIPVQRLIAPAVVIDCSKEAAANDLFTLEPSHIEAWEKQHGRIPDGSWVLMRTDWSKREDPAAFMNNKEDGPHTPGPSAAAIKFLVEQRNVNGWGVEAVGTDAGQGFAFEPAFPAHNLMHGANKFGLASLCNLDQLPPTGAILVTPPLKIEKGSGSPLRVLALVAS